MRLALDHHYSPRIAGSLRERGRDVVAAFEQDWHTLDDEALLEACAAERRTLVTNNVADFAVLAREWAAEGRTHHGLVLTSDASLPRTTRTIGRYVAALDGLMADHPGDDDLLDRVHWL